MKSQTPGMGLDVSRRGFLKIGGLAAVSAGIPSPLKASTTAPAASMIGVPFAKMEPQIGIIGTGSRGTLLLRNLLAMNAQVKAVCDVLDENANAAASMVERAGQTRPAVYAEGDHAYEKLVAREDINLVLIATPWDWHVPMSLAAMHAGKHVALEVPAAITVEDCWKLVDMSEQTRRHVVLLENCCYGYNELMLLRMIENNEFGSLLYAECAYIHDVRELLFSSKTGGIWRREAMTRRIGNLYPTHGLGPVANYFKINRGDRFDYMVSMSSPAEGLNEYRKAHLSPGDPRWNEKYKTGDMSTSLIKTANGLTITLKYDLTNPQPYTRVNCVAGTKGLFADFPPRIFLDGQEKDDNWGSIDEWKQKYEHTLWKSSGAVATKTGGHGGMDYIMLYRLMQCMKEGSEPDIDVYDAVAWSVPGPLSAASLQQRSATMDFPDFTRGKWKVRSAPNLALLS
jgi:Predicted dehydrogenases and related proteins